MVHSDIPDELEGVPWTVSTYPNPDPRLAPDKDREYLKSDERLFWLSDGSLAVRAGKEYPADERHLMGTLGELEEHKAKRRASA